MSITRSIFESFQFGFQFWNLLIKTLLSRYNRFHIKGTWSVHSLNGDYLSIPKGTGSCGYLFHEIPSTWKRNQKNKKKNSLAIFIFTKVRFCILKNLKFFIFFFGFLFKGSMQNFFCPRVSGFMVFNKYPYIFTQLNNYT